MSEKKDTYELTLGETKLDLDINKEDLLAVGIANYEQKQLARKKELIAGIRATTANINKVTTNIREESQELAKGIGEKKIQSFIRAGKRLGIKLSAAANYCDHNGKIQAIREVSLETGSDGYHGKQHTSVGRVTEDIEFTEEIIAMRAELAADEQKLADFGEQLSETVQNLSNLSTKEREVRAHLVVKSLQTTPEGQSLLDTLTSDESPFLLTDKSKTE